MKVEYVLYCILNFHSKIYTLLYLNSLEIKGTHHNERVIEDEE